MYNLRGIGHIDSEGYVMITKLFSYDLVPLSSFIDAKFMKEEKEIKRVYSEIDPNGEEDWNE